MGGDAEQGRAQEHDEQSHEPNWLGCEKGSEQGPRALWRKQHEEAGEHVEQDQTQDKKWTGLFA